MCTIRQHACGMIATLPAIRAVASQPQPVSALAFRHVASHGKAQTNQSFRRSFQRARDVKPKRITGRERPIEIIEGAFPAYVGRQERTAFQPLSGAMTPAGLHQSCLIPLLERGIIDCITTTGANLYHDAHRAPRRAPNDHRGDEPPRARDRHPGRTGGTRGE